MSRQAFHQWIRARLSLERLEDRWAPAAGQLDPFFGSGGRITTAIQPGGGDLGQSVVIDASDRVVVAGYTNDPVFGNIDFALARYNSDGTPDMSFGSGGKVITAIGSSLDFGKAAVIDETGRIVVAGYSHTGTDYDFALARYTSGGVLDGTFGSGGIALTPIGAGDDFGQCVALDGLGRIIVAGFSGSNEFALARFDDDGTLDDTFGNGGTLRAGDAGKISSVLIDDLDRIVVAGVSATQFVLARYNAAGLLTPHLDPAAEY